MRKINFLCFSFFSITMGNILERTDQRRRDYIFLPVFCSCMFEQIRTSRWPHICGGTSASVRQEVETKEGTEVHKPCDLLPPRSPHLPLFQKLPNWHHQIGTKHFHTSACGEILFLNHNSSQRKTFDMK